MKGYVFNTPFYTKTDWHTGRLILSRNGQTKGYGSPGSRKFARRVTFGEAGHEAAGVTGTTSFRGKKVGNNVIAVMNNALAQQSFGGEQAKEQARQAKIQASGQRLQRLMSMTTMVGANGRGFKNAPANGEYSDYY